MSKERLLNTNEAARLVGRTPEAVRKQIERSPELQARLRKTPGGRWLIPEAVLDKFGIVLTGLGSQEAMLIASLAENLLSSRERAAVAELSRDLEVAHAQARKLREDSTAADAETRRAVERISELEQRLTQVSSAAEGAELRAESATALCAEALDVAEAAVSWRGVFRRRVLRADLSRIRAAVGASAPV